MLLDRFLCIGFEVDSVHEYVVSASLHMSTELSQPDCSCIPMMGEKKSQHKLLLAKLFYSINSRHVHSYRCCCYRRSSSYNQLRLSYTVAIGEAVKTGREVPNRHMVKGNQTS